MSKTPKIYILSTGRSGTSFLYKYFNTLYPELNLSHQLKWSRVINIIGNIPVSFKLRNKLILSTNKALKKETKPSSTLDPLQSLSIYLYLKNSALNDTKIIHLVRDPRNFVKSFMNWKNQSLSKRILHYLVPFWQAFPLGSRLNIFRWIFISKFEKYCWVWYYKNTLFKELNNTPNYKLIKFEELTNSSKKSQHLKEVTDFLELKEQTSNYQEIASKAINKSTLKKFPPYEHWSQKQKDTLQRICGNLMHEFGYK